MSPRGTLIYLMFTVACGIIGFADELLPASYPPRGPLVPMPMFMAGFIRGLARILSIVSLLLFTVSLLFGKHLSDRHY